MVTLVGLEGAYTELLKHLILLDFDAIDAYDAAINALQKESARIQLKAFREDHRRHTVEVGALLEAAGQAAPTSGDAKSLLTTGKVTFASLMGDTAILIAMRTNEADTNTAYERAVTHEDLTPEARAVLERNLADERRHRAWIDEQLENRTPPSSAALGQP